MNSSRNEMQNDEFLPFRAEVVPATGFAAEESGAEVPAFQVADALWTTLTTDPGLKAELDRLIESRVGNEIRARVQSGEKELRESIARQAREDGLALGRQEAHAEAQALRGNVDEVCRRVLEAGHQQLNRYESLWMESLSRLLKRFLVRNDTQVADRIRTWLRDSLEGIKATDQVSVYLSPAEFERLSGHFGSGGDGWRWAPDATLADGDVRCETEMGGALFSSGDQLARLERLIDESRGK